MATCCDSSACGAEWLAAADPKLKSGFGVSSGADWRVLVGCAFCVFTSAFPEGAPNWNKDFPEVADAGWPSLGWPLLGWPSLGW